MTRYATVKVRAEHIAAGERGNPKACPIYLALCEHFGTARVGLWMGHNTEHVRKMIAHYDATGEMAPFELRLPIGGGLAQPGVPRGRR